MVQDQKQHAPRYRWSSPQDWLGDRINALIATTNKESLSENQYRAIADIATIANTIVNGTLNVDSDAVQDAFQDDMEDAGYFIDLDRPMHVLYEMEPIGSNGTLEANGTVHYFCSEKCRYVFSANATDMALQAGETTVGAPEMEDGTVCDECGNDIARTDPDKDPRFA